MGAKIVRDNMDVVPWKHEECKSGLRRATSHTEHLDLMRQKIIEEVGELIGAGNGSEEELVNEAADVYQAMIDYLALMGIEGPRAKISMAAGVRRDSRGGFTRGLVLET